MCNFNIKNWNKILLNLREVQDKREKNKLKDMKIQSIF